MLVYYGWLRYGAVNSGGWANNMKPIRGRTKRANCTLHKGVPCRYCRATLCERASRTRIAKIKRVSERASEQVASTKPARLPNISLGVVPFYCASFPLLCGLDTAGQCGAPPECLRTSCQCEMLRFLCNTNWLSQSG